MGDCYFFSDKKKIGNKGVFAVRRLSSSVTLPNISKVSTTTTNTSTTSTRRDHKDLRPLLAFIINKIESNNPSEEEKTATKTRDNKSNNIVINRIIQTNSNNQSFLFLFCIITLFHIQKRHHIQKHLIHKRRIVRRKKTTKHCPFPLYFRIENLSLLSLGKPSIHSISSIFKTCTLFQDSVSEEETSIVCPVVSPT